MKRYEEVRLEIIAFEGSDVITNSDIETPILGKEEEDIEY